MFNEFKIENFKSLNKRLPAGASIKEVQTIDTADRYLIEVTFKVGLYEFKDTLVYDVQPGHTEVMVDTLVALTYFMLEV